MKLQKGTRLFLGCFFLLFASLASAADSVPASLWQGFPDRATFEKKLQQSLRAEPRGLNIHVVASEYYAFWKKDYEKGLELSGKARQILLAEKGWRGRVLK